VTERTTGILCRLTGGVLCLMLAACAGTQQKKSPLLIRKAERLNSRGITATEQGRLQAAEAEFAEAYKVYSRVEDHAGMVTVLVNSSRMYRLGGQAGKAAAMTSRAGEMVHHVPDLAAEVWFERAKVSLLQGDTDGALNWSDRALNASDDGNRAMIGNLRADIHLKKGDWQRCVELARESLALCRSAGDRHEEADALRIQADCQLAGRQPAGAADAYAAALELDKELALPLSIYADLKGLSASMVQLGDSRAAGDYLVRAAAIAIAVAATLGATADLNALLLLDGTKAAAVRERLDRLQGKGTGGGVP